MHPKLQEALRILKVSNEDFEAYMKRASEQGADAARLLEIEEARDLLTANAAATWNGIERRKRNTLEELRAVHKAAQGRRFDDPVSDYEARVQKLEAEGCTRSDAQGIVDAEDLGS